MTEATDDELRARVEALEAENERKDDEIERLSRDLAAERARATNLEETIEAQAERIDELEAGTAQTDESDDSGDESDSMTPAERLIRTGEDAIMADVSASPRRAMAIAENFGSWGKRTPNGIVVKDSLKSLLETATGERLAWKQVHRAGSALEKFTKGAIQFKKSKRHGWMLVAEPSIVQRLERASSASTS